MRIFALTGGIASGKSTVCRLLRELCPSVTLFDCDAVSRRLHGVPSVVEQCREIFGDACVFEQKGVLDRNYLRDVIFKDSEARAKLEGVLHPIIRQECLDLIEKTRAEGVSQLFIADVPLLFEKGFDFGQELSMLTATSKATQIERLKNRNFFTEEMIANILATQMPVEEKMLKADVVFWNEGPLPLLRSQVARFLQSQGIETTDQKILSSTALTLPASIDINEFRNKSVAELHELADGIPGFTLSNSNKSQITFELLQYFAREGVELICTGILENGKESFMMLRDPARSFRPGQDDIHISNNLVQELALRQGHLLKVKVKAGKEIGKYLTVAEILEIEAKPRNEWSVPTDFEMLTPLFPDRRIVLEGEIATRLVDIVAPLGMGQRALIVAPPRGGKTILLKQIAKAIRKNHPGAELIVLLLDERPEEVTDFEETVGCTVYASTFDESSKRHAQVADLVLERAKRLVEKGKDVILLLDSITRLARGHNSSLQGNGPIGSGGVSPIALQKSRKFFSAARNVEEGGSLTILATALVETEARMDDVIFEEFKGTGNMEIKLDRELAERRIYPAIHIPQSGTRNDERLYHPDEFQKVLDIRRQLVALPYGEALELLLANLKKTQNNAELLLRGLR